MNPEIRNRFTGKVIVEADKYSSLKKAVEQNKANLYRANLREANLSEANLSEANLRGADLRGANLNGASFIFNKYICCLSWNKDKTVCIRIGCQCRPVEEYKAMAEELADKYDRKWWDKSGKYIFEFLCQEAERYGKL